MSHAVESIEIATPLDRAHTFIADPKNLPRWTSAFASASERDAVLRTPNGEVPIGLDVAADRESGRIDWTMRFPDGSFATAFSRLFPSPDDRAIYTFVLTAPPVPLEMLEGTLADQRATLREELRRLRTILES